MLLQQVALKGTVEGQVRLGTLMASLKEVAS